MRVITKILTALLAVALLTTVISPACAKSDNAPSTSPSLSGASNLKAPSEKNIQNYNKLVNELAKTERKIVKFFEQRGALAVGSGLADKTLTRNSDGTWHVTIYVTVPAGFNANVYDYLTNLAPIPGTFTGRQPNVVRDGYVEYDGLPGGSYVLQFDAQQTTINLYVADQVFAHAYAFGGFGGFISSDTAVGFWFDI